MSVPCWETSSPALRSSPPKRRKRLKVTVEHEVEAFDNGKAPVQVTTAAESSTHSPKFNTRGHRVPEDSPADLLTGDRDRSEHAKVLVSSISYGRTRRAGKAKAAPPSGSCERSPSLCP